VVSQPVTATVPPVSTTASPQAIEPASRCRYGRDAMPRQASFWRVVRCGRWLARLTSRPGDGPSTCRRIWCRSRASQPPTVVHGLRSYVLASRGEPCPPNRRLPDDRSMSEELSGDPARRVPDHQCGSHRSVVFIGRAEPQATASPIRQPHPSRPGHQARLSAVALGRRRGSLRGGARPADRLDQSARRRPPRSATSAVSPPPASC
jgi:hypothetical protein